MTVIPLYLYSSTMVDTYGRWDDGTRVVTCNSGDYYREGEDTNCRALDPGAEEAPGRRPR